MMTTVDETAAERGTVYGGNNRKTAGGDRRDNIWELRIFERGIKFADIGTGHEVATDPRVTATLILLSDSAAESAAIKPARIACEPAFTGGLSISILPTAALRVSRTGEEPVCRVLRLTVVLSLSWRHLSRAKFFWAVRSPVRPMPLPWQ